MSTVLFVLYYIIIIYKNFNLKIKLTNIYTLMSEINYKYFYEKNIALHFSW